MILGVTAGHPRCFRAKRSQASGEGGPRQLDRSLLCMLQRLSRNACGGVKLLLNEHLNSSIHIVF